MHPIQRKLIGLASHKTLDNMTLRQIGKLIEEKHPQKIKHHLNQLKIKGLLTKNYKTTSFKNIWTKGKDPQMMSIPILGAANCGQPLELAVENLEGFLTVSSSMVPKKKGLFAIRAIGSSMNRANINGKSIEDGDYVIIDSGFKNPKNGDYVLSVISDLTNIKKFIKDVENKQIVLISESTQELPPIYIHPTDFSEYMINGKVIKVIKKPTQNYNISN